MSRHIALIVAIAAGVFSGCDSKPVDMGEDNQSYRWETVNGHRYLWISPPNGYGGNWIHDPDCPGEIHHVGS